MSRRVALPWLGVLISLSSTVAARAEHPPGALCAPAIHGAERAGAIPASLLTAIGQVESGRRDPRSGGLVSWPWTINAEGQGSFFDSSAAAIEAVRQLQARGVRSIDVGCMQVNLQQHPQAFATLAEAFDPQANARYAARFLNQLHAATDDWSKAAALYHSATPKLAEPYRKRVLALWPGAKVPELAGDPAPTQLANAWAATLGTSAPVLRVRAGPVLRAGKTSPTLLLAAQQ